MESVEEEIIMTYKRLLDAENDFKLRLSIAQKLHYSEVRKFIEKNGKEKFTLAVWEIIYEKYEGLYSKLNKNFVDNMRNLEN